MRLIALAAAALVLLEITGQLVGKPNPPTDPTFTSAREWSFPDRIAKDHDLFWRYRPGQTIKRGFLAPGTYRINSRGFRTPEYAESKPGGTQRVLCLGESTTFGVGIADEGVWPRALERQLNALDPQKRRWEVLNLAVTDYTSHQGLILARRELPRLRPDLVLINFSWADHQEAAGKTDAELSMPPAWMVESGNLLSRSAIVRWAENLWYSVRPPSPSKSELTYSVWRVPPENYPTNIEAICAEAIRVGARPVIVTSPIAWPPVGNSDATGIFHIHHRYRRLARYAAIAGGGEFVELANEFDHHREFFSDPQHDFQNFNARGHAFAGEFLARYLLGATADTTDSQR
ncbi:MAG: SGNH/GDSL hydrolase family protein [candidate division Zixibacteria bacterium]|nr:SGNH/GDSL hydrolase family protein [candidate division Zixibacteria bacterium]